MLRIAANMLATGLLFLGFIHNLEVIAPADGKQSWLNVTQSVVPIAQKIYSR